MSRRSVAALLLVAASACASEAQASAEPALAPASGVPLGSPSALAGLRDSSRAALLRDVRHLASPALGGRGIGSAGLDSAGAYLARQYLALQIDALIPVACDAAGSCRRSYFQTFAPPRLLLRSAGVDTLAVASNVVAMVPGTDPALGGQWIVIGAHYDHLGTTGMGARDRRTAKDAHLGADDNASGTAAVLELARRLANDPPRRPVMLVHFAAEEIGLIGSNVFVQNAPVPVDSIVAMVNLDMVGRLGGRPLQLIGLESSPDWPALVRRANSGSRLVVREAAAAGGSDHMPFAREGVPAVHLFTGMHPAYHTRDDTVAGVDFDGLVSVVEFAERLIRAIADDERRPRRVPPR